MTPDIFNALLLFVGALFGLAVLFVDRNNKRFMTAANGLLDIAEALAKATPSPVDDEQVRRMREALNRAPVPDASTTAAADALIDERLNGGNGQAVG